MRSKNDGSVLTSRELSDIDAFFTAFEETQKTLRRLDIPVAVAEVGKDELGWYTNIRIRPNKKY
jgi:hypothetical protein